MGREQDQVTFLRSQLEHRNEQLRELAEYASKHCFFCGEEKEPQKLVASTLPVTAFLDPMNHIIKEDTYIKICDSCAGLAGQVVAENRIQAACDEVAQIVTEEESAKRRGILLEFPIERMTNPS